VRFHIDEPAGSSDIRPALLIRGWCFDEGGVPVADVELSPGRNRVVLEADSGGTWSEFESLELTCPWRASAGHAWRMARFWPRVLLGRTGALQNLPKWEQDPVFLGIQRRWGDPLTTEPHHAARAVAKEKFPQARLPPGRLPKVSVVTPSLRQAKYIEQTIRSVLDQEGVRIDYTVRDGGSDDGTVEILRRHSDRLRGWVSEPDHGQADAVNKGFAAVDCAPDDVMAYVNSDDLLMPGAIRHVAEYFARHPKVDVVYGHRVLIDECGNEIGRWLTPRTSSYDLRLHDFVPQETLFWRKRLWDYSADWDLLLRFADAGAVFHRLPWFLGLFRRHPSQKTGTIAREVGVPEDERLRRRTLGRDPSAEEIEGNRRSARIDSALLAALWRRGWRL